MDILQTQFNFMIGKGLNINDSNGMAMDEFDLIVNMYEEYKKQQREEQK